MIRKGGFFLLAILSGILTALCFPKFNFFFLSWVSLIPLLLALRPSSPKNSFGLGLVSGFIYYAILLYWIPAVPAHYGNLSTFLSVIIYLILVFFLSLYWALFGYLFSKVHQSFPRSAFLMVPFIWIALEYALTYIFTGFPWGLLGYSQVKNIYFIQTAAVTGVYGLSFLIVLFQSLFVFSLVLKKRSPFFIGLILILLVHLGGFLSLKKIPETEGTFQASVIQGNVSSDIYWDRISSEEILTLFNRHLDLSRRVFAAGSKLIIWPEFTVPLCFSCPEDLYQYLKKRLFAFVQQTRTTLLLGTNETAGTAESPLYFNTALCLSPDLATTQYYKMHLVPFGEYTPYEKIFSFIKSITHAIGEITAGTQHVLHEFQGIKFGSPICYEIIFPSLVRKFAQKGAGFLVTITNDGWYGRTSAPHQHFLIAVFRAVENRRYLLRAATTGISGIIDPYGRILSRSQLMTATALTGLLTPSQKLTFYTRYGDVFPLTGLTLAGVSFILALVKRQHERKKLRYRRELS